jgi:outer membrane protein
MRRAAGYFITAFSIITIINSVMMNSAAAETLTLRKAVGIALENNSDLKAHYWSIKSQKEDYGAARGNLYPKIGIEEKFIRTDNPTYDFMARLNQERFTQEDFAIDSLNNPRAISDFQTSFNFEQPLFVPKLYYGMKLAEGELTAKNKDLERMKNEVSRNVVRNALLIQTAKQFIGVSELALKDAQEHKRLAGLRYETGLGLYSDVLRADTRIKNAEAEVARSEGDLEIAKRALGLLLGRNEAVDIIDEKPVLPLDDLSVYLDAALQREDVKALNARHENSINAVKMEKSVFFPEIGIGGSYLLNDHRDPFSPEGESYIFTAFLRWNLFDASSYHKVKKAEASVNEIKERVSGLEQEIQFRVHEAYIRIREKEKTLSLAKTALADSEEALRLVRTRYENSLAPMVDLLDTQLMLDNARARLIKAENEYMNSIVDLYNQSGMLLRTLISN